MASSAAGCSRDAARVPRLTVPYPLALALTLVIEVPLAIGLGRHLAVRQRRAATVAALASLTSHPVFWFLVVSPLRDRLGDVGGVLVAEGLVTAWETLVWRRGTDLDWTDAVAVAVATNAVSFAVGVAINVAF
jgi:hypothetical protein